MLNGDEGTENTKRRWLGRNDVEHAEDTTCLKLVRGLRALLSIWSPVPSATSGPRFARGGCSCRNACVCVDIEERASWPPFVRGRVRGTERGEGDGSVSSRAGTRWLGAAPLACGPPCPRPWPLRAQILDPPLSVSLAPIILAAFALFL